MIQKFLLVDDDPDDTDLFEEALRKIDRSIQFYRAEDCREVIAQLKEQKIRPEIIFLDINMPDMNGWDCLAALKSDQKLKDIPVLMYSTSSVIMDGEKAITRGAHGYLEKPTTFDELKDFLDNLVTASASEISVKLKTIAAAKSHRMMVA